jgi:DNA-binding NarL/FixJ family response regulator
MKALARGCAPKQIAFELELSISAVRLYIQSAKVKLGAGNTNHAIARVVQDEHLIV